MRSLAAQIITLAFRDLSVQKHRASALLFFAEGSEGLDFWCQVGGFNKKAIIAKVITLS